jgi:Ca2+:H+ antiporter
MALVPIAAAIVRATEQIATRTGDAIGSAQRDVRNSAGVDHRTGGAASGYLEMVRGSLIGVLANLLLTLGLSFFLGGVCYHDQRFNASAARTYSTMMLLAAISMGVPSGFRRDLRGAVPPTVHFDWPPRGELHTFG